MTNDYIAKEDLDDAVLAHIDELIREYQEGLARHTSPSQDTNILVSIYNDVKDEKHLVELLNQEPLWDLLTHKEFSSQLFHVGEHSSILQTMKPTSIDQLAMVLAIIRPAKRHLLGKSWTEVENQVWVKPTDGSYYFKKAHAIAYAHAIVVQMNLICNDFAGVLTPQAST